MKDQFHKKTTTLAERNKKQENYRTYSPNSLGLLRKTFR